MDNCPTGRIASHPLLMDSPIENLAKDALRRLVGIKQDDIADMERFSVKRHAESTERLLELR